MSTGSSPSLSVSPRTLPQHRPRRSVRGRLRLAAFLLIVIGGSLYACNIPVFRYALERWAPDRIEVIIFHTEPLSTADQQSVNAISQQTSVKDGPANAAVREYLIGTNRDEDLEDLWKRVSTAKDVETPYVVVRSKASKGARVNSWRGPLRKFASSQTLTSPVRQQISRELLGGTSVVWLVLRSEDEKKTDNVVRQLNADLKALARTIELPDGIGLPGSELMSEVPLLMKFKVVTVDPADPRERYLVELLQGLAPESLSEKEPLAVPVFGRGRALEVIPGSDVTTELTKDLTMFLCAACSCQVKDMNPGFDLLMATDWTTELYGEDGQDPVADGFQSQKNDGVPVLIDIPAGRKK